MSRAEKVLKIIGLKPNQEFHILGSLEIYRINEDLTVQKKINANNWGSADMSATWFLLGKMPNGTPINIIILKTKEEEAVIKYAQICGFRWLCKSKDGDILAFKTQPYKSHGTWSTTTTLKEVQPIKIHYPLDFLSWEDEKAYWIGDVK